MYSSLCLCSKVWGQCQGLRSYRVRRTSISVSMRKTKGGIGCDWLSGARAIITTSAELNAYWTRGFKNPISRAKWCCRTEWWHKALVYWQHGTSLHNGWTQPACCVGSMKPSLQKAREGLQSDWPSYMICRCFCVCVPVHWLVTYSGGQKTLIPGWKWCSWYWRQPGREHSIV
jgi:hypothetical protein